MCACMMISDAYIYVYIHVVNCHIILHAVAAAHAPTPTMCATGGK